ncbi:MAG: UDP-N-acetylmuramoyl-L-alanine--D-glutamate ligase [Phycisphaerales bacterium]|nr:UDP-N-acetylmuramoyl-L-alanine--D-glutamate ligase [Phycisphaerales bacterium]
MIDVAGRRVTVMGLGRFGGGLGATRWLAGQGASVLVTDLAGPEKLGEPLGEIADLIAAGRVELRLGEHREGDFRGCDLLVANPAVPRPWENRYIEAARSAGVRVTSEIGLLVERLPDRRRVIGVTGSAGKSTTTAMVAHALNACGRCAHLGGNIGGSLLEASGTIAPSDWVVLELSSAMLHWLAGWSPALAVVTNVSPNHIDWHGTLEHYVASKRRITADQAPGEIAVLGPAIAPDWPLASGVRVVRIAPDARVDGLAIPGSHNALNGAVASAVVGALEPGLTRDAIEASLREFRGLPHRLRLVGNRSGVRYFDDSKSTTPEASLLAMRSFEERGELGRVHLIAGGYDKGSDLTPIAARAGELAGLYCIGKTGPALAGASAGRGLMCGDLEGAMAEITRRANAGDVVLLSPGCASWDQFENFEARGRAFAALAGLAPA